MNQPRTYLHSIDEIDAGLRDRILDLCHAWKLEGNAHGGDFIALNPLRPDRSIGSFRVALEGKLCGLVKDFATGEAWTPLNFTAELWFGGDIAKSIAWAKRFLGLDGGDPAAIEKTRRAKIERKDKGAVSDQEAKRRGAAHGLYAFGGTEIYGRPKNAAPDAPLQLIDWPAVRYLRGRGVDLARFPGKVKALRHHPDLHHGPSCWCKGDYNAPGNHVHYPAMLAPISAATGQFMAVHRTFLQLQPDARVTKAPVGKDAKLCLGRYAGGLIRLWKGIKVNPETGETTMRPSLGELAKRLEAGRGEKIELHLAEGIEDALSIAQHFPELTVAAAVSVSNWGGLVYPPAVGAVTLWRDNDAHGAQADRDFDKVIRNAQAQGLKVKVVRPPEGFKDVNDVVQRSLEGAA